MAYCANCGQAIAEVVEACPHCGHPNELHGSGAAQAGFGSRFAAWLIDAIVVNVAAAFLFWPAALLAWFLYGFLMLGLNDGRSLGKMALGIRVAHPDGRRLTMGDSAARAGMSLVSGVALAVGYLWAIWDPQRRTWHDLVAGTRVFVVAR